MARCKIASALAIMAFHVVLSAFVGIFLVVFPGSFRAGITKLQKFVDLVDLEKFTDSKITLN